MKKEPSSRFLPIAVSGPLRADLTNWDALRAMTDEEVLAAALSDPDAQPVIDERRKHIKRVPQVKVMRRALRPKPRGVRHEVSRPDRHPS